MNKQTPGPGGPIGSPGLHDPEPFNRFLGTLNERQRRHCVGMESLRLGWGGDTRMSRMTGMSRSAIRRGRREFLAGEPAVLPGGFARKRGGGRPLIEDTAPQVEKDLAELVKPETAGDPCSGKKWVRSRLSELTGRLRAMGHRIGKMTVRRLLFRQEAKARAVPYGLYEVGRERGHLRVGISGDTPRFAVGAIAHWCRREGRRAYRRFRELLLLADAGGSNGCRTRAWKYELQRQLADALGLTVTVCPYPTGASKWHLVEHRLFGPLRINWAGEPLTSLGKMLQLIRGTEGVQATAELDRRRYPVGEEVSNEQMRNLNLKRARVCPEWNYTLVPHSDTDNLDSGP